MSLHLHVHRGAFIVAVIKILCVILGALTRVIIMFAPSGPFTTLKVADAKHSGDHALGLQSMPTPTGC